MLTHVSFVRKVKALMQGAFSQEQAFMCYFDFAEFKLINRYYGTKQGDIFLKEAGDYVGRQPEVLTYKRMFSDQFACVVIAKEPRSEQEIQERFLSNANRFLAAQQSLYPACNLRLHCGICAIQNDHVLEALDNANLAWREAKKVKSTAVVVFNDAMLAEIARRFKLEAGINEALKEDRFTFYLQPKVDLFTGKITGAEALARRLGTDGRVIFPDDFLSIMEENGTVVELDRMMLHKVCKNLADRMARGLPVVRTSVNLSRLHIQTQGAAERLHSIAQAFHIPPGLLEFELTETILLNQVAGAKALGDKLRGYGYSLSIDDFGAGYAGVNLIQELEFDVMKLDKRFLSEAEPLKTKNRAILPDLLHTMRKLQIKTICEGVETAEQCILLSRMGCGQAQGYYFSRPIPSDDFYAMYGRQNGRYALPHPQNREGAFGFAVGTQESLYDSAIKDGNNGVCYIDRAQKIWYWNKRAGTITGYRADEILGRSCWDIGLHPMNEDAWALYKTSYPLVDTDSGLQYYEIRTEIRHRDGHSFPISLKVFPAKVGDEIIGAIEIFGE